MLGRWGPNHAADPIIIKRDKTTKDLYFVGIQRKDTGEWALPGGMVEAGDSVANTLVKEFMEEATGSLDTDEAHNMVTQEFLNGIFAEAEVVYKGYVDDPRNTDNAWMETVASFVVISEEMASDKRFKLQAGDDAKNVKWLKYSADLNLYASHSDFIRKAIERVKKM